MSEAQKIIKNGILGFGSRGVSFIGPILNESINNHVTTVIDPDISRSKYFLSEQVKQGIIPADEAEKIRFIADIDELEAGEVDALWLTASESVRTMICEKAVKYGAHIYMEKGLSHSIEGGKKVVEAMKFRKPGQQVFMGFNFRHYPVAVCAKQILDEGKIGKILYVQYIETLRFRHGSSFFTRFHRDIENSGGMMVTKSCHDFDFLSYLIGARPERVFSAQYKKMFGKGGEKVGETCHTCEFSDECEFDRMRRMNRAEKRKYSKTYLDDDKVTTDGYFLDQCCFREDTELKDLSHVIIEYENDISATYTQVLFAPKGNRVVKIFGDNGSLFFDESERSVTVRDRWNTICDKIVANNVNDMHGGSDSGVVKAFFNSIRTGEKPISTIADGVWALGTAFAAYDSADQQAWVDIKPYIKSVGEDLI